MFYGISVVYDISYLIILSKLIIILIELIKMKCEMNLQFEKQLFEYDFLKFYSEGL